MKKNKFKLYNMFIIFLVTMFFIISSSTTYAYEEGKDALFSQKLTITLHLTAHDDLSGVSEVMISNYSDFRGSKWEKYSEEKKFTFDRNAKEKIIYIKYKDNAGNVSKVQSKSIPESFFEKTIFINKDDLYTNKNKIILNIKTTEYAKQFRLSSDKKNWTSWENFKDKIKYDTNGSDGKKEIYIQFKDANGNIIKKLVPGIFVYDKTSPVIKNIQLSLDKKMNKVNVAVDINDNLSGIQCKKWTAGKVDLSYFKNNGTGFNENKILLDKNGDYTFYAEDRAGNVSIKNFTVNIINNDGRKDKNINKNIDNKVDEAKDSNKNIDYAVDETKNNDKDKQVTASIDENTNEKVLDKDIVSKEKKGINSDKTNDKMENNKVDEDNKTTNNISNSKENNINNDKNKNSSKKQITSTKLNYLWILWLLILIIIYILWKKYKKYKNRNN